MLLCPDHAKKMLCSLMLFNFQKSAVVYTQDEAIIKDRGLRQISILAPGYYDRSGNRNQFVTEIVEFIIPVRANKVECRSVKGLAVFEVELHSTTSVMERRPTVSGLKKKIKRFSFIRLFQNLDSFLMEEKV